MRHPESAAGLLRLQSSYRTQRAAGAHDCIRWQDAAAALADCSPLAFAAFRFRHSDDPPDPALVEHLVAVCGRVLSSNMEVTAHQLVEIALREERSPEANRTIAARHRACGVTRCFWRYNLARAYAGLGRELDVLNSDAWRALRRRLADGRR